MIVVLLFDITFLAQFISISTLFTYCLIMSIVIFKKASRKVICSILMLSLFVLSLIIGFANSIDASAYLISFLVVVSIVIVGIL